MSSCLINPYRYAAAAPVYTVPAPSVFYDLNEALNNVRVDNVGGVNLTASNMSASAAGVLGDAATFTPGSNPTLQGDGTNVAFGTTGGFWSCSFWFRPNSLASANCLVGKGENWEWCIQLSGDTGGCIYFQPTNTDAAFFFRNNTTPGSIVVGNWHHVAVAVNTTAKTYTIYLNGVSANGSYIGTRPVSSNPFCVGTGTSGNSDTNGRIDLVAYWRSTQLTAAHVTELRNGGAGLRYTGAAWSAT